MNEQQTGLGSIGRQGEQKESWLAEFLLPGLFTMVLTICLAHMGLCALQAQTQHPAGGYYAISAFAN